MTTTIRNVLGGIGDTPIVELQKVVPRGSGRVVAKLEWDDWFTVIDALCELSAGAVQDLRDVGFVVIPGPVPPDRLAQFAEAYDSAMVCAAADDVSIGTCWPSKRRWTGAAIACLSPCAKFRQ